ncbi:FUN14 domain-containing protein 1 [Mortierella sp. NVP85]|nr:FUN14 domain-containing protein 1 [Mortierella sp. NVP85]
MGPFATFSSSRHVVHCAAATNRPGAYSSPELDDLLEKEPIFKTKELTFGMMMGLCSGYLFKKLGKLMMLVVGFGFVWLQLLAGSGYIQINWPLIERRFKETFDADGDGKITLNDARYGFRWLMELLTKNFQFKATYVSGYVLGFHYG